MNKVDFGKMASFSMICFSILASAYIIINTKSINGYILLPVLPISFAFVIAILSIRNNYLFKSIVFTGFIFVFFIKLVINPIVLVNSNFIGLGSTLEVKSNIFQGILLAIYEFLTMTIAVTYFIKKKKLIKTYNENLYSTIIIQNISRRMRIIVTIMISSVFLLLIITPNLAQYINFMKFDVSENLDKQNINGIVFAIFDYMFNLVFFIIPFLVFQSLAKMKNKNIAYILNLILITIPFTFALVNRWYSPALSLVLLIMTINYYKKNRIFTSILITMIPIITIFIAQSKSGGEDIALIMNAYFPSVESNAVVFVMNKTEKYTLLMGDILRSIPFIAGFFTKMEVSTHLFSRTLFGYNRLDQIFPWIAQAYYFIGALAPVIGIFITNLLCKWEIEYIKNRVCFVKLCYLWLIVWSIYMVLLGNINGYIQGIFQFIIPFLIITNNKVKIKK